MIINKHTDILLTNVHNYEQIMFEVTLRFSLFVGDLVVDLVQPHHVHVESLGFLRLAQTVA